MTITDEQIEELRQRMGWTCPDPDTEQAPISVSEGLALLARIDAKRDALREAADGVTHRQRCTARVWDNGDMTDCGEVNCEEHAKPVEPATAECRAKVDGLDCNELDRNVDEMCDPCLVFCSANPHLESAQRAAHRALARIDAERERAARADSRRRGRGGVVTTIREAAEILMIQSCQDISRDLRRNATQAENAYPKPSRLRDAAMALAAAHRAAAEVYDEAIRKWQDELPNG